MNFLIVGAGMAGLLAARMLKARGHTVKVAEKQPSLPNNHKAVLRFRSNLVSDVTGIKFKKVTMIKTTNSSGNSAADALLYSKKAFGTYRSDRSIPIVPEKAERYIAPPDFISQLAEGIDISFDMELNALIEDVDAFDDTTVISTIPMPSLMEVLTYNHNDLPLDGFKSTIGYTINETIKNCDAYATVYCPHWSIDFYRASITGDQLIIEFSKKKPNLQQSIKAVAVACDLLGVYFADVDVVVDGQNSAVFGFKVNEQKYGKIEPVNDVGRKRFMASATDHHNIFSLGRFATWRPSLLLDDLVNDINLIEGWAKKENNYERRLGK